MAKKRVFFIIFFLIFILSLPIHAQITKTAIPNNNIEVFNIKQKHIEDSHSFVGVNWIEDHEWNREIFVPNNLQQLAETLKNLNIDIIRYPGGLNATLNYWDVPYKDVLEGLRKLPKFEQAWLTRPSLKQGDRLDFYDFMKFCKENDIKATVQINPHSIFDKSTNEVIFLKQYKYDSEGKRVWGSGKIDWNLIHKAAESTAQQVKWVKDNGYSNTVKYWELGNEEYAFNHFLNVDYTGYEYSKVVEIFIREMSKEDPSIKFIVTMVNPYDFKDSKDYYLKYSITKWNKSFLSNKELLRYKNNIFAFSQHIYIKSPDLKKDTPFEDFSNQILTCQKFDLKNKLTTMGNLLSENGYNKTKIFMNEFNVNDFENKYMHSWISALSLSKKILSAANNPYCYHSDYHALFHFYKDISLGFGLLHFAKDFPNMPFIPYPAAYTTSFLNENIKGDILKTSFDSNEVYVTALLNNANIKVIMLNMDKKSKIFNLKLSGFNNPIYSNNKSLGTGLRPDFTVVDRGDSMGEPSEIRLMNVLGNAVKVKSANGAYKVELPAYTISVLEFKN